MVSDEEFAQLKREVQERERHQPVERAGPAAVERERGAGLLEADLGLDVGPAVVEHRDDVVGERALRLGCADRSGRY